MGSALLAQADPQAAPSAGGAEIAEVIIATAGATIASVALLVLGLGHRSGRVALLGRASAWAERVSGYPGWAVLPAAIATVSLLTAVFGMYWDIALHIGVGRDEGPLANPAHYFILIGLFGIFAAGFIAMVLPRQRVGPTSIRVAPGWHAPLGGVLLCACGAFSLLGFPLDDGWHRIFGQDVTLWGPTHLMLIGGASMSLLGIAVLLVEGMRARQPQGEAGAESASPLRFWRVVALTGGFMLGLSTFQAEFDFGVPQFRFVFHPLLIMLAAGVGLVAARIWGGRGAALGAVAFFLAVRGVLTVLIGPVFGEPTPYAPLYLASAAVVELVALRISPDRRRFAFALASGTGIGTIGLAAEWAWSHAVMPLPWPAELAPEGIVLGFAAAVAGALLGGWIGHRLSVAPAPTIPALRRGAVAAAAVVAAVVAYSLYTPAGEETRASVALTDVEPGPERTVEARIDLEPRDAGEGAEWLQVTAWQGSGLIVDRLEEVSPGSYRTTEPIPVYGNWKSLIRLHRGNSLQAAPIFMPHDEAIPAEEVPATPQFTRSFIPDHEVLQREQQPAPGWVTAVAYGVVIAISLALLALLAWGLHRLGTAGTGPRADRRAAPPPEPPAAAPEDEGSPVREPTHA